MVQSRNRIADTKTPWRPHQKSVKKNRWISISMSQVAVFFASLILIAHRSICSQIMRVLQHLWSAGLPKESKRRKLHGLRRIQRMIYTLSGHKGRGFPSIGQFDSKKWICTAIQSLEIEDLSNEFHENGLWWSQIPAC
jgi:hypothetical protein